MNDLKFVVKFLCSFFEVFHAYITEVRVLESEAEGIIKFLDGDSQVFVWHYSDLSLTIKKLKLLDVLVDEKWICGDKIIISKQELTQHLKCVGWSNANINDSINFLCSLKINMVDDGEETDSFFIHF